MARRDGRDPVLTVLGVAMALLALSNLLKPVSQLLAPESSAGFVFFGTRLHGVANAIVGPLFGVFLAVYAWAVWTRRRIAVPIAIAYALYVPLNLILFARHPPPDSGGPVFMVVYVLVAIGVSALGAVYLYRRREALQP
ncbi:MAG TPA: hypothetical protein VKA21_08770 [Candidatus Binatia bacterium]|nr:hypothetical protein [Candidatus Binatia bacterium]